MIVHTAPKSSTKFSLADLKAKMVNKEKGEESPVTKPVHVPATRSSKRKKSSDSVINLESFEDLTADETKDKLLLVSFLLLLPALGFFLPVLCMCRV
jgi:hypothetical protein